MRRRHSLNPAALLIDQHGRFSAANAFPERPRQRTHLILVGDVALEDVQPQGLPNAGSAFLVIEREADAAADEAFGNCGSALRREEARASRSLSDEALASLAFQASAERGGVRLGEADHPQAVDGLAVHLRFMYANRGAVEFGGVLAVEPCQRALGFRLRLRRGELNGPPARRRRGGRVDRRLCNRAGRLGCIGHLPGFRFLCRRRLFWFGRSAVLRRLVRRRRAAASGAVVSVLPTATRAADLGGESLVGNSILGVDGCATPVASLAVFGAGFAGASARLVRLFHWWPLPTIFGEACRLIKRRRSANRRSIRPGARSYGLVLARGIPTSRPAAAWSPAGRQAGC